MLVTGLGSLPGDDIAAALRMTFDVVEDFPYLPELPGRGPGSMMIGRGVAVAAALPADLVVGQWRIGAAGVDQRRAVARLRDDLDLLEETAHGFEGRFKFSLCGPWTLAAALRVASGGSVLADGGARRDICGALAEGVSGLVTEVQRRLPTAELVVQIDEPALPAVLGGTVPTAGGYFTERAIALAEVTAGLRGLTDALSGRVQQVALHSCAPGMPVTALVGTDRDSAAFSALSVDLDQCDGAQLDRLAAAGESGTQLWLGVAPTLPAVPLSVDRLRTRALGFWERTGASLGPDQVVLTPACGLAGWPATAAREIFVRLNKAAQQVQETLLG